MRWKCLCSYDGTDFHGWQSQSCASAIQDILEARLRFIFDKHVRIHGSGRTDSGAHANGQVFHFDAHWQWGESRLIAAINCGIPMEIRVFAAEHVADTFHARFSAVRKRYEYRMLEGAASPFDYRYVHCLGRMRPDTDAMNAAAKIFLGRHDFSQFGANGGGSSGSAAKTMCEMQFIRDGRRITFVTEGSGYLYKMVRIMAGCLLQVGLGRIDAATLASALAGHLDASAQLRRECLPANGLFLDRVYYNAQDSMRPVEKEGAGDAADLSITSAAANDEFYCKDAINEQSFRGK
ncbi:MAG: tRNA pseudouridine(38-40) synthase TruA [Puniceicoccales bacterium]|jgi:tRNA pseudouridine38-40 synthase|nr:tRNA pseudouridine(38-40) synthase TruA [Puniceicoccales bacterium]